MHTHTHRHTLSPECKDDGPAICWRVKQVSGSLVESLISNPEPVDHTHTHTHVGQHKYYRSPQAPLSHPSTVGGRFSSYTVGTDQPPACFLPIMHLCCSVAEAHKPDAPRRKFIYQLRSQTKTVISLKVRIWEHVCGIVLKFSASLGNVCAKTIPACWYRY